MGPETANPIFLKLARTVCPALVLVMLLATPGDRAANPGLPFVEDFQNISLRERVLTSAEWSVSEQALVLAQRSRRYDVFGPSTTGSDIQASPVPNATAVGDLNGDGHPDVATGNNGVNRVYLNNGTTDPFNGVSGNDITGDSANTQAVALRDIDHDGDLDVIAGNDGINRLYLNNGTADPFNGVSGSDLTSDTANTTSIVFGDLDGDGDLDALTGNDAGTNRLYLNNGTADPFNGVSGNDVTADTAATSALALADMNSDGALDLVVSNDGGANRLYLNNGTADPFNGVSGSDISGDSHATLSVTLGDVDGDYDVDVVAGNNGLNRLYLNNGTADPFNSVSGSDITADSQTTQSVSLGDADGDGDLDLFAGNASAQINRLYFNNGTADPFGGAAATSVSADALDSQSTIWTDVDFDNDLDLVVGHRLYLNDGSANPWDVAVPANITSDTLTSQTVALGDVDGDGDLDLIDGTTQENILYLNNGTSDPWNGVTGANITSDAHTTFSVELGDLDGDGDLDLITGNFNQENRLYLNNGTADPFNGVTGSDITTDTGSSFGTTLEDVDGDGDLDLVVANLSQRNRLYLNNGTADPFNGVTGSDITTDTQDSRSAALGDLDGDGDLDLVIGNTGANRLYLNNGTPDPFNGVSGSDIGSEVDSTYSIVLGDADSDGDLDVFSGNRLQTNKWYSNNGTADPFNGVSPVNISGDMSNTNVIRLFDVDGDGDLDLVAGNLSNANRLYLNNGTVIPWNAVDGVFVGLALRATLGIAVGDVDGDGGPDIVTGDFNQTNMFYTNPGSPDRWINVTGHDIRFDTTNTKSLATGDMDGDGDLDMVAGNNGQTNLLYRNNGLPIPWMFVAGDDVSADADDTHAIAVGDIDGNGSLDVVAGNDLQTNRLYLNNGTSAPFNAVSGLDITSDVDATRAVALGDVDGDGNPDVVAGNLGGTNRLYLSNGTSDPFLGVSGDDITADTHDTYAVALADVDHDGDLDVVAGNDGINRVYLNNGTADPFNGVTGSDITADVNDTRAIAVADVDDDGDLDVATGNHGETNRLYLNNDTTDPFNGVAGSDISSDTGDTLSVAVTDLDRDDDLDILAGNDLQANRLYVNNGSATPFNGVAGSDITSDTDRHSSLVVDDMNDDGYLDLAVGNNGELNRFYRSVRFQTGRSRGTSKRVDTEVDPITNATLTSIAVLPPNTSIDYYMSNNGGATWNQVVPGVPYVFPTLGIDLRWRAELLSRTPLSTPFLDEIQIITTSGAAMIGDRVWEDYDGDGIQDPGEPGLDSVVVHLYDELGGFVDFAVTDINGNYNFGPITWYEYHTLRFFPPSGYGFTLQDQGSDDLLDSDIDSVTGETPLFQLIGLTADIQFDAGMVFNTCASPDESVFMYEVGTTTDGNNYPVLNFQDPNQPTQISGYNIYRSSDPAPPPSTWPVVASDVIDMDEGTPNKQWVDTSGDVSPSGIWYYQVTAYNNRCPAMLAEGPF